MEYAERTINTEEIYNGSILKVRVDTVQLQANGKQSKREIVEHNGGVAVLAVDEQNKILLVKQYRKAAEKALLELPAGKLETGEEPLDCARRELIEETGYEAGKIDFLFSFYTTPGFCTEILHLYLARDLKEVGVKPDEDEIIENYKIRKKEIMKYITEGKIEDGKTITGLMYYLAGDFDE